MNSLFRAFNGIGSLRHEVRGTFCGSTSAAQRRTWSFERSDGEIVRPFERPTLARIYGKGRNKADQRADTVLRAGSARTGRRGYRPRIGTHAPGRGHDRPGYLWRAAGIAGLSLVLAACGGGGQSSSPTAKTSAVVPASVPVAASSPYPTTPTVASTPVTASAPAASAPVAASSLEPASTPAATAPASTPLATPKTVLIEIHGDDAMYGITSINGWMPTITQQSEPVDSQTLLRAQFGDGITISNLAEGGTASTLVNMMNGVDGGGPPFAQRMATSKADIELVNHAINDDLSQSLGPYADALVAWVQAVRAAGKVAVLEEPNPVCDGNHPYLANYVSVMDNIAAQYNVPLIKQYDYIQTLPNWCSHFSSGLYPDDYIDSIKAQRQAAALAPLAQAIIGGKS